MTENLSNDVQALLNGAITNVATSITTTGATGFPAANFRVRIDDELLLVTSTGAGTNWTVQRGVEGSTAVAHGDSTPVVHVLTTQGLDNFIQDRLAPNLLINPNWIFDQINEGTLYTITGGGADVQTVDGWSGSAVASPGVFKVRRLTDPENAALQCLEVTCTTIDASIAATDAYYLHTAIEGQDALSLMLGTALAETITVTFNFKTSVTGIYGISLANSALNRSYVGSINAVDTSEHTYSVTLALDTSGTWLYDTGVGLRLRVCLAAGSNFQTATGSWGANNMLTTSSQVNFMSSTSNIAYLKRIQLAATPVAVPLLPINYSSDLLKCQRYYTKSYALGTAVGTATTTNQNLQYADKTNSTQASYTSWYPVQMRATPTATIWSPASGSASNIRNIGTGADLSTGSGGATTYNNTWNIQVAGVTAGNGVTFHWAANARLT